MSEERYLIVHEQPKSPIAEAYRALRTNIQFSQSDSELKTILFTSAGPEEGKSTNAANIAIAMAQSGKKIILVDCDLRRPVQNKIFNLPNRGLTNALVENLPFAEAVQATQVPNLQLVTSGPVPLNPSELLATAKMQKLLDFLKEKADIVIIDTPPAIAVTDACVLAAKVDGVILVVCSGRVKPEMAKKAKEALLHARGRILWVVLNRVQIADEHAYYYYYYSSGETVK